MKKKLFRLLLFISMLIIPFGVRAEDNYFYTDDSSVLVEDEHNHSVFAAGDRVKANANIHGIYFGAGSSVDLSGKVSYGFVAGQSVNVEGEVENDLFAAGGAIVINKDAKLNRDAYLVANNVDIRANISGNVFVSASIVTLENVTIDGDLKVNSNQLIINDNVNIKGTLYVNEKTFISNEDKITCGNKVVGKDYDVDFKTKLNDTILSVLTMIFTAIVLALVFPKLFKKLSYKLSVKDVFTRAFVGLSFLVIAPIFVLLLFISSVGAVLGVILVLLYILSLVISMTLVSYVIGHSMYTKLCKQKENLYVELIIGVLLVKFVELIPYFGSLFFMFGFIYGLGLLYKLVVNENKIN